MKSKHDIIIIGGGPAGIACAVQLKRYGLSPLMIEKQNYPGGLIANANLIENYPGFPNGISGQAFIKLLEKHIVNFDVNILNEEILNVDYNKNFIINTSSQTLESKLLVVASGTKSLEYDKTKIEPEAQQLIFTEIVPIINSKNKTIAIFGSGDAAFDYALNLAKNNKVMIINRTNRTKCLKSLYESAHENNNIDYIENDNYSNISCKNSGLLISTVQNKSIEVDYVIFGIGRQPNLTFLSESFLSIQDILLNENKLFYIGDVCSGKYRQASIAVADGIRTAMIIKELF